MNAFALDLFGRVREMNGNLVLSPMSISIALAMALGGARGDTANEMMKALHHLQGTPETAMTDAGKVLETFREPREKIVLRVANRLYGDRTYAFHPAFIQQTRDIFGAPLVPVDFQHATEVARTDINRWVLEQTEGRIKDVIPRNGIDASARLVLVNAIYFLADWARAFDKASTLPATFSVTRSETRTVPTMHDSRTANFAKLDGVTLLELPYWRGEMVMMFALPDAIDGIVALESRLRQESLDRWVAALKAREVVIALPKFQLQPAVSISLVPALTSLGMISAFDSHAADFSGMADRTAFPLSMSSVFHKAFVRVDESGTEAAAATAVGMVMSSAVHHETPVEFKADHPFLFFLRHAPSGIILFMGRIADPGGERNRDRGMVSVPPLREPTK